jgi:RND family efflux transporter MFP subunit
LNVRREAVAAIMALLAGPADAESLNDFAASASCLIAPNNVYKLAMPSQGAIATVSVHRADKVESGEVIAELESGVEKSQVEAARARADTDVFVRMKQAIYEAAEAKVDRQLKLRADKISSQQSLEEAQSAAAVAKADVAQAELDRTLAGFDLQRLQATLERRVLRAPAKGVVTSVDLHAGEYADPANAILTLTEIDPLKVDVYLPASAYSLVEIGKPAVLTPLDAVSRDRTGEIVTKDPQIDASSGLFLVEIKLPNPDGAIPAGIRCRVAFP